MTLHHVPSPSPAECNHSPFSMFVRFLSKAFLDDDVHVVLLLLMLLSLSSRLLRHVNGRRLRQRISELNIVPRMSQTWNCKRSMGRMFSYTYKPFIVLIAVDAPDFYEPPLIAFQEGFGGQPIRVELH